MVKLEKTVLPKCKVITKKSDYQNGPVFDQLYKDCHGKCYICEDKPVPYVVEHIIAHKNDPMLEFDWNNMLLGCMYCNSVKNKREYDDGIINPVKDDPEIYYLFQLSVIDQKETVVIIKNVVKSVKVSIDKTCKLLNEVYNNDSRRFNQKLSSYNLKNRLSKQIKYFYLLVDNYKTEHDVEDFKKIMNEISRKSEFAAFKRGIVRGDPELMKDFAEAFIEL